MSNVINGRGGSQRIAKKIQIKFSSQEKYIYIYIVKDNFDPELDVFIYVN